MMKNKNLLPIMIAALALAIGAIIFLMREPSPTPLTSSVAQSESTELPTASSPAATVSPVVPQTSMGTPATQAAAEPGSSVLATVNGVEITAKDLDPGGAEQARNSAATQAMLDRAIERELILQAANAQGLTLTAEQQQALEKLRAGIAGSAPYNYTNDPAMRDRMQAEIDFRVRDTTAQMLLSTLVLQPKESAPDALTSHDQNVRPYLDDLRSTARIERGK